MKCPHCLVEVNEAWSEFGIVRGYDIKLTASDGAHIVINGMVCPNEYCREPIIKAVARKVEMDGDLPVFASREEWFVFPRKKARFVDPAIDRKYADDYLESSSILDDSPKASAALSRRILADLLKDYGQHSEFKLSSRVDAFISDRRNPRPLRENLHYLREIADFAAHTQKDELTGVIIEVEHVEAEWCLDVIDRLFDYYILSPLLDEKIRSAFDDKLDTSGRKPIKPLPED